MAGGETLRERRDVLCVVGKRDGEGWKACLMGRDLDPVMLTPARARELAAELIATADICEGYWGV